MHAVKSFVVVCSRSMRNRPGSLYQPNRIRENGDVMTGATVSSSKRGDDFDIKVIQQKKHEAEVKRWVDGRAY